MRRSDRFIEPCLDNRNPPDYVPLRAGSIDGCDGTPHDSGIVRAANAEYHAENDKKFCGEPLRTLFVGRLNLKTTEEVLLAVFERYGPVSSVRVVRDIVTGMSRGYAFVTMKDDTAFQRAWRDAHRMFVDGSQILVEYEKERVVRGFVPRRLGGGLGGNKVSGQLRFGGRERPFKQALSTPKFDRAQLLAESMHPEFNSKMGVVVSSEVDGHRRVVHLKQDAGRELRTIVLCDDVASQSMM